MNVTLLSSDGCPNAQIFHQRLVQAFELAGLDPSTIAYAPVHTPKDADRHNFRGSPSILVNGIDPFADSSSAFGLSCRIYRTDGATEGSPSIDELLAALRP